MNNILSYCGLTYARMRASEKDLPVPSILLPRTWRRMLHNCLQASTFAKASDKLHTMHFLNHFSRKRKRSNILRSCMVTSELSKLFQSRTKSWKNKFSCLAGIPDYTKNKNDSRQEKKNSFES